MSAPFLFLIIEKSYVTVLYLALHPYFFFLTVAPVEDNGKASLRNS